MFELTTACFVYRRYESKCHQVLFFLDQNEWATCVKPLWISYFVRQDPFLQCKRCLGNIVVCLPILLVNGVLGPNESILYIYIYRRCLLLIKISLRASVHSQSKPSACPIYSDSFSKPQHGLPRFELDVSSNVS